MPLNGYMAEVVRRDIAVGEHILKAGKAHYWCSDRTMLYICLVIMVGD